MMPLLLLLLVVLVVVPTNTNTRTDKMTTSYGLRQFFNPSRECTTTTMSIYGMLEFDFDARVCGSRNPVEHHARHKNWRIQAAREFVSEYHSRSSTSASLFGNHSTICGITTTTSINRSRSNNRNAQDCLLASPTMGIRLACTQITSQVNRRHLWNHLCFGIEYIVHGVSTTHHHNQQHPL